MAGAPRPKYPFPLNIVFNAKLFYGFFIVVMIASMAAVGFGASQGSSSTPPPVDRIDGTPEPTPEQQTWPDGAPPVIRTSIEHEAVLRTNQGEIVIDLAVDAPQAVNSFAFLAAKNFFDGTAFFFSDEYFTQAGDPTCSLDTDRLCSGLGGPGYTLELEDSGLSHTKWSVAAPALGEGQTQVHGSQFRILFQDDTRLDGKDTVFGTVTSGQPILESLGNFNVCSISTSGDCEENFANALIIEDVEIREK